LKIALLLDTSSQMGTTYNADVVAAALSFLKQLPQGATFSIWSTSDRPKVIVSEGTDLKTTEAQRYGVALSHRLETRHESAASQDRRESEAAEHETYAGASVVHGVVTGSNLNKGSGGQEIVGAYSPISSFARRSVESETDRPWA
jgi:hypothetical protein